MATPFRNVLRKMPVACLMLLVAAWLLGIPTRWIHAESSENVTIRFSHFGGFEDFTLWRSVIDDFHNLAGADSLVGADGSNPNIIVRQEYVVGLSDHYNVKLRQRIISRTLPEVALIQLGPFHDLADHFADLTELAHTVENQGSKVDDSPTVDLRPWTLDLGPPTLVDRLDSTGVAAFQIVDAAFRVRQQGLPVSGGNLLIYCNRDCFDRAATFRSAAGLGFDVSLPEADWTMDQFLSIAKHLTCDFDGDGVIDQFGFWHPRWVYYLPFLWSFGADLADASLTRWTLTGPAAEKAFQFYRDLLVTHRVSPREAEVPQLYQDTGFLTGKVAMCVNGPWFQPFLAQTKLAESYFIAQIPSGPGGRTTRITWDAVVMAPDLPTAKRHAAERFVRYILSPTVQRRIARSGRALPALKSARGEFVAGNSDPSDPRRRMFVDALDWARPQPPWPDFGQLDIAINRHLHEFLKFDSQQTPAAMLAALARDSAVTTAFPSTGDRSR